MESILFVLGRIIFGTYFGYLGWRQIANRNILANKLDKKSIIYPSQFVWLSGISLILAAASVIFGVFNQLGFAIIVVYLITVNALEYDFWNETNQTIRKEKMASFLKNSALIGASIMMLAAIPGPWKIGIAKFLP